MFKEKPSINNDSLENVKEKVKDRILSDAELIESGGEVVVDENGNMKNMQLTEKQVNKISKDKEREGLDYFEKERLEQADKIEEKRERIRKQIKEQGIEIGEKVKISLDALVRVPWTKGDGEQLGCKEWENVGEVEEIENNSITLKLKQWMSDRPVILLVPFKNLDSIKVLRYRSAENE